MLEIETIFDLYKQFLIRLVLADMEYKSLLNKFNSKDFENELSEIKQCEFLVFSI